jgi:cytochrome P450
MRDLPSSRSPLTRVGLPSAAAGALVRAFIRRDTRGCHLAGEQLLNRFPASLHCAITWLLEGDADQVSCGGQPQHARLPRCAIAGCHTHPVTTRSCGDVHAFMAVFYPDAFHALFGIDLAQLQNRSVDARQVLPPHGVELIDAVFLAGSDDERESLVERFVLAHGQGPTMRSPASMRINRTWRANARRRPAARPLSSRATCSLKKQTGFIDWSFPMMKIPRPPGPRDHLFGLRLLRQMERDLLGFWHDQHRRHGDTICVRLAHLDCYSFTHPEQIREVLVDKAQSFIRFERHMQVLGQVHGQSLLITEGEAWQKQRRTLQPGFSPKRFPHYAQQMTDAIAQMLATIPADGQTPLDFEHAMNMLAADVILRTMFSGKVSQDTTDIERAVRTLSEIGYEEMFSPFSLPDWLPLPRKLEKRNALRLLDGLIWSHIEARRAEPETGDDLLGMLLSAADKEGDGSVMTDQEVRDQLMTIFMAGHETTAAGLAWAGWVLAAHPEIAAKATEEVDRVLGARVPSFADLAHLPWLGMVIKETLRLYSPSAGVFMRRAVEDVQIGQWPVPKGSLVSILSVVPHLDERWFQNPGQFDPSRFDADTARNIPRGAYFPFGTGPRVCIGNSFATMEMTLILAMLLQRFAIRPSPGQGKPGVRMQVTVRPEGGLRLTLQRRDAPMTPASPAPATPERAPGCPFH